jgi:mannose-6-phosphate isomerase-like protein (cupin superfamily)
MDIINFSSIAAHTKESYKNIPLTGINDHVIRLSIMTEPYFWHRHPNSDETFLSVEGSLIIELDNETIELSPGQLFTVPKNANHRTRPGGPRSVNLTFELQNIETIKIAKP